MRLSVTVAFCVLAVSLSSGFLDNDDSEEQSQLEYLLHTILEEVEDLKKEVAGLRQELNPGPATTPTVSPTLEPLTESTSSSTTDRPTEDTLTTVTLEYCNNKGRCSTKLFKTKANYSTIVCYRESSGSATWYEANRWCYGLGGRLAEIHDEQTLKFVADHVTRVNNAAWLGARDEESEGWWRWESGANLTVTNWGSGQSTNQLGQARFQDCMVVNRDGTWSDFECEEKFYYICERFFYGTGHDECHYCGQWY